MKLVTKNLMFFAFFFFIGAVVFRYGLSYFLENLRYNQVWIITVLYFVFNFAIGWFFGKRDRELLPLYDIGFRFHFVTYLIFNSVSLFWFLCGFHSQSENIRAIFTMIIFWGIGLLIHYIFYLLARKKTINGINKEEIFE